MATNTNFQGRNYIEPGSYAAVVYNPTSVVNVAEFGNTMIIDVGLNQEANPDNPQEILEFSGGSGVSGQLATGDKAVYEFDSIEDFLSFTGGGKVGNIAEKLFTPRAGTLGVPKLYYARAATTVAAEISIPRAQAPTTFNVISPDGAQPVLQNVQLKFITDKTTYYQNMPAIYTLGDGTPQNPAHPWDSDPALPASMPWIIVTWTTPTDLLDSEKKFTFYKDGQQLTPQGNASGDGTIDGNILTTTHNNWLSLELASELGVTTGINGSWTLDVEMMNAPTGGQEVSVNYETTGSTEVIATLVCKNEGLVGNASGISDDAVADGNVKKGYVINSIQSSTGTDGTVYYQYSIYKGTYGGTDNAGEAYGSYSWETSGRGLITTSPEVSTYAELIDWLTSDRNILAHFKVEDINATEKSDETTTEIAGAQNWIPATGGTTEYLSGTEYADVLEAVAEYDITFFLCQNVDATGATDEATNGRLFTHINTTSGEAKFTSFMAVPGGSEDTDLFGEGVTSQAIAKRYDSNQVFVVHGAPEVTRRDNNGIKQLEPIYLTAAIVGLNAGLEAQTPITFKRVGYESYVYNLKKKEREKALQAGIMHVRNVSGYWVVNQGITSIQQNRQTYNLEGKSFELSIELIKAQINKELILEGQLRFTGQTAAQASPESIKNFTETKLKSLEASPGADNLLINWKNVKVSANNGDYVITYDFTPNIPVNKTFFVGNVLDFVVNA